MTAQYRFTFSEDFLIDAALHYRRQSPWRRPFSGFKGVFALIIVVLGAVLAAIADLWPLAWFALFASGMLIGWPIHKWILRKRFRKSPYYNDEIVLTLSDDGIHAVGKQSEIRFGWPIVAKVRRFSDGLMVFQGPHIYHWLPNHATDAAGVAHAERLLKLHVKDFADA
jgi:hypothetical protein